jgi:hypothetical protein
MIPFNESIDGGHNVIQICWVSFNEIFNVGLAIVYHMYLCIIQHEAIQPIELVQSRLWVRLVRLRAAALLQVNHDACKIAQCLLTDKVSQFLLQVKRPRECLLREASILKTGANGSVERHEIKSV